MVALLVLVTVLAFIAVDYYVRTHRTEKAVEGSRTPSEFSPLVAVTPLYRTPGGVFFDRGHTWMYLEESGDAKLGIDDFASNVIGSIDEFETMSVGQKVAKGDVMLRAHNGPRALLFKAPFDGVIDDVNTELMSNGELRGIEPYTNAWLYRIRPTNLSDLVTDRLNGAEATDWLKHEVERLKVFLSTIIPRHPALGHTMQDGGMPVSGLTEHLDDTEWRKLEQSFFA
jgi:glycine cleavage system H lipoate-binding protein